MFRQFADGKFTVGVSGDFHCGPDNTSPKTFSYEVEAKYPDYALDARGFLLDNFAFETYFNGMKNEEFSCEKLAQKACLDLCGMAGNRCTEMRVGIRAIDTPTARALVEYSTSRDSGL